jgi:hypothetical protein
MKVRRLIYLAVAAAAVTAALVLPGTAGAANNLVCGGTIDTSVTLVAAMDCSGTSATSLEITKSGVTLNLGGQTITGNNSYDVIYIDDGLSNVTIENGTISGGNDQIDADWQAQNLVVQGMTLTGAHYLGMRLEAMAGGLISGNTVSGAGWDDIRAIEGAGNAFFSNTLSDPQSYYGSYSSDALKLKYEQGDAVEGNNSTISGNTDETATSYYDDYSDQDFYYGNVATGGYEGFYAYADGEGTVTMTGNGARGQYEGSGYDIEDMYADTGNGAAGPMTLINDNIATGGAVTPGDATDPTDYEGFYDNYNPGATWTGNLANRNDGSGFYFDEPWRETIAGNTANYNGWDGFYLSTYGDEGAPTSFANNSALYNQSFGFEAEYATVGSGNSGLNGGVATNNGGDCLAVTGCS